MSTREYYYNTETQQYAVAVLEDTPQPGYEESFALFGIGEPIDPTSSDNLDDHEWVEITKDNADLFLDAIHQKISALEVAQKAIEGIFDQRCG